MSSTIPSGLIPTKRPLLSSSSTKSTATDAISTFPQFAQLPAEIQVQIWKLAFLHNDYFNHAPKIQMIVNLTAIGPGPQYLTYSIVRCLTVQCSHSSNRPKTLGVVRLTIDNMTISMCVMEGDHESKRPEWIGWELAQKSIIQGLLQTSRLSRLSALEAWREVLVEYVRRQPRTWQPMIKVVEDALERLL